MIKLINRYPHTAGFLTAMLLFSIVAAFMIVMPERFQYDTEVVSSTKQAAVQTHVPFDPTGVWETEDDTPKMVASITRKTIAIDFVSEHGETNFWNGTFDQPASNGSTISSRRVDTVFMMSGEAMKEFTYKDGSIFFDVAALGSESKIKLIRR